MKDLIIVGFAVTVILAGCSPNTMSVYTGTGVTPDLSGDNVDILGQITACQGGYCKNDETGLMEWPMSLQVPPPASTYQAALRKKAARVYKVPENEIIVGEITVGYYTEIVGTIRGWTATATVGRKRTM